MKNKTKTVGKTTDQSVVATETRYETKSGVCEHCADQYDESTETTLYLLGKRWACGDCANNWMHEKEFYQSAYGSN
jgi:hypothetical protein